MASRLTQRLLVLMSDTAYHPRLPAVLNTLLHRKNSVQQIIHTLTRAVQYVPRYTEMEKDLGLLTWRLGGPQLLYAFNAAGLLPQWGVLRDLHKQSHLVMGPDVTAADILRILPDDLPFSAIYIVIDEVAVDGRIRVLVQDGVARLYGFCHEHCGPVELQSEDAAYDLQEKLLDGTVHRATVGTVVLLVPMNEKYHRGFPLMLYGSCNRFDSDMMVSLLTGITRAFESPELAARGRIMGLGTDGDARRAAAHIRCLVPTSAAAIVLPGVDQYRTPWGITNFDSPHLAKRMRNVLLSTGMQMECGHVIRVATMRQLAGALSVEVLQAAYVVRDRMNVALAIKLLRQIGILARLLADAEVRENVGRTITLVVVSDDLVILAAIVDGFLDGHL